MAGNKSTITVRILGNAKQAITEVGKFNKVLGSMGKAAFVGASALGAVAALGGVALFKIGQSFNDMENTIIKGTGATGAALEGLLDSTKAVLATVPDSGDLVAGALADVNTFFGQTGAQLETSTKSFLDFSRVMEVDLNRAITGTDAILTQFGETGGDLDEVLGDLTRISQATGAPMEKLLTQMETFGPIFANAGFGVEQTAAIFGQLEQAGVDVTRVGPALNKFFRDAAGAGQDPQEALKGMVEQIGSAESATDALSIATAAFGAEGAQRMVSAIRSGNFDLEDFNGLLGEGTGLVAEQAAATETFGDKWARIKNKVFVGLEPLASKVFDGISDALDDLGPYLDRFAVWFNDNLPVWMADAEALFARIRPIIVDTFAAVKVWVDENWPQIRDTILEVFQAVSVWLDENWPAIQETILQVLTAVQDIIIAFVDLVTVVWNEWGDDLLRGVQAVFEKLGPVIQGAVDVVTGIIGVFTNLIKGDWSALWTSFTQIFTGLWAIAQATIELSFTALQTFVTSIADAIVDKLAAAWSSVVSEIGGLGGRIASAAVGIFDGVKDAFRGAINFIIDGWNSLSFSVPSVDLGPLGSFGGPTIGTPNIPRLAKGGLAYSPMLAVVGDNPNALRDPEIISPRSMIVAAVKEALSAQSGGFTIENVNVVERSLLEELNELELLAVAL